MSLAFPASPSTGQIYQGWRWSGTSWDPNYAANFVTSFNGRAGAVVLQPSDTTSGNRVLLKSASVSTAGPSFPFFFDFSTVTQYDEFELVVYNVLMSAGTPSSFAMRISWDGSTWDATSNYAHAYSYAASGAAGGSTGSVAVAYAAIGNSPQVSPNMVFLSVVSFFKPWSTTTYKMFMWQNLSWAASGFYSGVGTSGYAAGPIQPIKGLLFFDIGGATLSAGTFELYGIVK